VGTRRGTGAFRRLSGAEKDARDQRILTLDREGLVRREIAALVGCTPGLVSHVLRANGVRYGSGPRAGVRPRVPERRDHSGLTDEERVEALADEIADAALVRHRFDLAGDEESAYAVTWLISDLHLERGRLLRDLERAALATRARVEGELERLANG